MWHDIAGYAGGFVVIVGIVCMLYVTATTQSPHEWMVKNYKDIVE